MARAQYPIDGKLGKNYKVTSNFGWRVHPIEKTKKHHNGVDLWGAAEPLYIEAWHDGVVIEAGTSKQRLANGAVGGIGWYVDIQSKINGKYYVSRYGHMVPNSLKVKKGQKVEAGTVLGKMGTSGASTGKHLHFEIVAGKRHVWDLNGKGFVDPLKFIQNTIEQNKLIADAPKATPEDAPVAPAPVHGKAAQPAEVTTEKSVEVIARKDWGALPLTKHTEKVSPSKRSMVVIHHSVTSEGKTRKDVEKILRQIDKQHRGQDWGGIGYNLVVDFEGRVYEARGLNQLGIHASGVNTKSYGICYIGDGRKGITEKGIQGIKDAVMIVQKNSNKKLQVVGHKDTKATACPGPKIYKLITDKQFDIKLGATGGSSASVAIPAAKPAAKPAPAKAPAPAASSVKEIAREVIAGKWGNGPTRTKRLTAAGHDVKAVQAMVNNILSGKVK
jgi:hypothetical protein